MEQIEFVYRGNAIEVLKDGQLAFKLHRTWFQKRIKILKNSKDLKQTISEIEKSVSWNFTLWILGKRSYFTKEIRDKLKQRFVRQEYIDDVIEKAKSYGYLDDEREIEHAIKVQFSKGRGARRIVLELARKSGLQQAEIETLVQELLPIDDVIEKAQKVIAKYRLPDDRQKAYACLARRGFSFEIIEKVLAL